MEVAQPEEHRAKCKAAALIKPWIHEHETALNGCAFTYIDVSLDKLVERLATDTDVHEAVTRARAVDLTALQDVSLRQAISCLRADDHTAAAREIENMLAVHISEQAGADTE